MSIAKTAAAIALLLAPTGVVMGANLHEEASAVEQHTSFVEIVVNEGNEPDPGYAAVAGLVTCEPTSAISNAVLWFDDQVLFRKGKQGPDSTCLVDRNITHVWVTEDGAPDPRGNPSLVSTNKAFEFTDPNNRHWVVREYKYHAMRTVREESTEVTVADVTASVEGEAEVRMVPFYTWVVKMKSPTLDPTINEHYNFVTVVDFEKLTFGSDGHEHHDGEPGDPRAGNSHNASDPDEEHRVPHRHDTADVELWIGEKPAPGDGPGEDGARTRVKVLTPSQVDTPEGSIGPATIENRE